MRNAGFRHFILAALALAMMTLVGYWAWNTAVELIDGPRVAYQHVVAVLAILALLRIVLLPRRNQRKRMHCQRHIETELAE